jgi:shikimate dehydrogenase
MTEHYAVIGNPIHHSKSPLIHTEFAKQTQQNMDYIAREIALGELEQGLKQLADDGFKGINVTVPFKEQAWQLVDNKSAHAVRAGAINTIKFNGDGSLYGDNTDGLGLCRDLTVNNAVSLSGKRILLLGAGGAARGVVEPLLNEHPAELIITNRTESKAQDIAELFTEFGKVSACGYNDIEGQFDLIINATSASLHGQLPPLKASLLSDQSTCYDMMYSDTDTAFISWAKQHGANKTIDGLGMLVEQAAEAFNIWRGIRPETSKLLTTLRHS